MCGRSFARAPFTPAQIGEPQLRVVGTFSRLHQDVHNLLELAIAHDIHATDRVLPLETCTTCTPDSETTKSDTAQYWSLNTANDNSGRLNPNMDTAICVPQ